MGFQASPVLRMSASVLALVLVCVPLTIGAIWAFPIWDDAWFWLLLQANGTGSIVATWVDRPVMATVWSLLATSEPAFWRASLVAQALLWPSLGIISAILWAMLFPQLRQYAMVVGCITVAPIISKVQMVTANIALAHLLSVVLSYGALVLLLRFVMTDGRLGGAALGLSLLMLGLGILITEYALPVVIVMVIIFWSYARRASDAATKVRALRAIIFSSLTAGAAYAIFFVMADFSVRHGEVSPVYAFTLGTAHLVRFPFKVVECLWQSIAGGFVQALREVSLTSKSGVMAAAYGALVAGLLYYGSRSTQHKAESLSRYLIRKQDALPLAVAVVAGILPTLAMGRIPWNPVDGMSSRFELPLLPITVGLIVLISFGLVRQRFWAVPILLLGFVAGNATFTEVRAAIRERQQMSAIGAALQTHVSSKAGHTVAAVVLPDRSLGPRRPYELAARLTATWPAELRGRFWAFRFGGVPPIYRPDTEAEAIFGSRGSCTPPREFKWGVRHVTRDGLLDQLIWVRPETNGSISVEPYCINDQNEHQVPPKQTATRIAQP
jgi:hypothetical protein